MTIDHLAPALGSAPVEPIGTAKKKTLSIPVDAELHTKIAQAALDDDRTIPVTARRILQAHFNK